MIEGKITEHMGPKVWRLTKRGREYLNVTKAPIPFNSPKVGHYLAMTDLFLSLYFSGGLGYPIYFDYELREEYITAGKTKKYCPDVFYVYEQQAYLCEIQLTALSSTRWSQKWAVANEYFGESHYKKASWQRWEDYTITPEIVVISTQQEETIRAGSHLELTIYREIPKVERSKRPAN